MMEVFNYMARESTTELYLRICGKQPEPPKEADVKAGQYVRSVYGPDSSDIWVIDGFVTKHDFTKGSARRFIRVVPVCSGRTRSQDIPKTFFRRRWKPIKVKTFGDPDHGVEPEYTDMIWRPV